MSRNKRTGPAPNLEALEQDQLKRTRAEDEGVNYDVDRPDQRGSTTVTDPARGETRRKQYEGGADLVSEID